MTTVQHELSTTLSNHGIGIPLPTLQPVTTTPTTSLPDYTHPPNHTPDLHLDISYIDDLTLSTSCTPQNIIPELTFMTLKAHEHFHTHNLKINYKAGKPKP
eukprot:10261578-Alexandrium_andersonii.AAC.1